MRRRGVHARSDDAEATALASIDRPRRSRASPLSERIFSTTETARPPRRVRRARRSSGDARVNRVRVRVHEPRGLRATRAVRLVRAWSTAEPRVLCPEEILYSCTRPWGGWGGTARSARRGVTPTRNVWGAVRAIARVTDRRRFHRDERAWSRSLRGHLNLEIVARPDQSLDLRRSRKRAAGSGTRGREPSRLSTAWRRGTRIKGSSRLLYFPPRSFPRATSDAPTALGRAPRRARVSSRRGDDSPPLGAFGSAARNPRRRRRGALLSALRHARSASRLPSPPRPSARSAPDTPRPRFLPSPWSSSSPDRTPRLRARARRGTPRPRTRTRRPRRTTPRPPRRLPPPRARRPPRRRRAPGSRSRSTASARSSPRGTRASLRGRRSPRRTREPRRRARRGSDAKRGRPAEKKFSSPRYARRLSCVFLFCFTFPPSSAELRLALALALGLAPAPALLPPPPPPLTSP